MDSASDLDAAAKGLGVYPGGAATVRGRRGGSHRKREDGSEREGPIFPRFINSLLHRVHTRNHRYFHCRQIHVISMTKPRYYADNIVTDQ